MSRCPHCGTCATAFARHRDAWAAHRRIAVLFGDYTAAPVLDALHTAIRCSERWTWRLACPERHPEAAPETSATPQLLGTSEQLERSGNPGGLP